MFKRKARVKVLFFVWTTFLIALISMGQTDSKHVAVARPVTPVHVPSVSYHKIKIGHTQVYTVEADLDSTRLGIDLYVSSHHLSNRTFPHESFSSMIMKTQPTAAINGTYYDTRTFIPVGTLVSDGHMMQRGSRGIAFCVDENNHVGFYKIRDLRNFPWQHFKVVLSTGPTLVESGQIHLFPKQERFRDPDVLNPARRSAIGITRNNRLLLVAVVKPVSLRNLARIMKKLGAEHAIALDGGSSSALYYRGRYLVRPSRMLTNIFLLYDRKYSAVSETAIPKSSVPSLSLLPASSNIRPR